MEHCGAEEARANLAVLLERAHRGETTVVTRRGEAWAAIAPLSAVPPAAALSPADLRGSGKGLWGADPAATVAAMRDEWT